MAKALDVANYFLAVAPEDEGISHLKLQKLCAYAQAINLAAFNQPLFDDEIEAWTHGPVVPSVYHEYKCYGNNVIPSDVSEGTIRREFTAEELSVLSIVNSVYGRFTAWALRQQSHWDFPGNFDSRGEKISKDAIQGAFQENPIVLRLKNGDSLDEASYALDV